MSVYDGDFEFDLKGKRLTICFDWKALSYLSEFPEAVKEIAKNIDEVDAEKIAEILSCGLKKYHPEMTKEYIMEWSPPLLRSIIAIDKALSYAYFGNETPEQINKKKVKKATIFKKLFKSH